MAALATTVNFFKNELFIMGRDGLSDCRTNSRIEIF